MYSSTQEHRTTEHIDNQRPARGRESDPKGTGSGSVRREELKRRDEPREARQELGDTAGRRGRNGAEHALSRGKAPPDETKILRRKTK